MARASGGLVGGACFIVPGFIVPGLIVSLGLAAVLLSARPPLAVALVSASTTTANVLNGLSGYSTIRALNCRPE
ncbi:MAG: hypothetical protein KGQ66_21525 [Acidobacteriota bacterium]|nr:hypothetical protein [Acidobacteriota bacterium]